MSNQTEDGRRSATFTMLSDWHVGTGQGIPGSIDALTARDPEGFPFIPAKTVVGMWRDAMETLTFGLDGGASKPRKWRGWVDVIFGSQPNIDKDPNNKPRPSVLSVGPAVIDNQLKQLIGSDEKLQQALTFVKASTAIEECSGTAKDDSLRFTEMARIDSVLTTTYRLEPTGMSAKDEGIALALLTASAALVERIGGNRRRGAGRCTFDIGERLDTALDLIKEFQESPPKVPSPVEEKSQYVSESRSSEDDWRRYSYSLNLKTPVAIVSNTLGNMSDTLDFIPGTYLLGHLSKRLGVGRHFAPGDFQVSPATIAVAGKRGLPVPKVIHYEKVGGGFDKPATLFNRLKDDLSLGKQKKNYRVGYISDLGDREVLPAYSPTEKVIKMHNTIDDAVQRPTANVGGMYSRQAIAAGQTLIGEFRVRQSVLNEVADSDPKWYLQLNGEVRLGTSKKDDYGLAELRVEEFNESREMADAKEELVVYLASDVLLRDKNLRPTNSAADLGEFLGERLNVALTPSTSLIQTRRIESWHDGWGFPRPTLLAMAAGSVVVFKFDGEIRSVDLLAVENEGIGERRGEGYGELRFNPKLLTSPINGWNAADVSCESSGSVCNGQKTEIEIPDSLTAFARTVELAAWREEISRAVRKAAADAIVRKNLFGFWCGVPSNSQIGGFRSAVSRLKSDGSNRDDVLAWLRHLRETPNRSRKWAHGFGKIEELLAAGGDAVLWDELSGFFSPPALISRSEAEIKRELWSEAIKGFVDACARAHGREKEAGNGQSD